MPHLLCFGLGYSARAVARRLTAEGWQVTGTARTAQGADLITRSGCVGLLFDGTAGNPAVAAAVRSATHLLVSVPPGAGGDPVLAHLADDIAAAGQIEAIVYLSTVGVYGDAQGAWVDEATPPAPLSDRSRARLAAEKAWTALGERVGRRVAILRLAGIYGPGRSAVDDLQDGTARRLVKPGQVFNRIHVEDVATAAIAALLRPSAEGVYNIADDEPAPPQDVVAYAAGLLGVAAPPEIPFETAVLSPMARSFYAECKRVRNERMKNELGITLAHPTFRQGLAQISARAIGQN